MVPIFTFQVPDEGTPGALVNHLFLQLVNLIVPTLRLEHKHRWRMLCGLRMWAMWTLQSALRGGFWFKQKANGTNPFDVQLKL